MGDFWGNPCLRDLGLREEYRSDTDNLVSALFVPCLSVSTSYDRAVGYFTSAGIDVAARGFESFVAHDGRARLVASPVMNQEDIDAIIQGYVARDDLVARRLLDELAEVAGSQNPIQWLAWLVADERLDIRLAMPTSKPGIYHEKVGVFEDAHGCRVAFSGSPNETAGGLVNNFEAVDLFFSWDESSGRAARKSANFERLWSGETRGLQVIDVPRAVRERLIELARREPRASSRISELAQRWPGAPDGLVLRDYQTEAVEAWLGNSARGILSMATGSGKTKTALAALAKYESAKGHVPVVVVVPYVHLVDQWSEECRLWGHRPINCYESSATWEGAAWESLDTYRALGEQPPFLVTTLATSIGDKFRRLMKDLCASPMVLVADEVHHLGAHQASGLLDARIEARLGLSATPQRWKDETGTALIESYFGGVVFEYSLQRAISGGQLAPYRYEPRVVELDRDELEHYRTMMETIESLASTEKGKDSAEMRDRLQERSRLLNTASGKLEAVRTALANARISKTLFYCASRLQMGAISDTLRQMGVVPAPFTAEENRRERAKILQEFASGRIPAIVAMKALDEGVDVPDTRVAHLLASSGNPREFIQRRGRVLRRAPGKRQADIIDYVVFPEALGPYEREVAAREVRRVLEFAENSMNPDEARNAVWPILDRYDLLHLVGGTDGD